MGDIADVLYIEEILGALDGDSYEDSVSFKFRELKSNIVAIIHYIGFIIIKNGNLFRRFLE